MAAVKGAYIRGERERHSSKQRAAEGERSGGSVSVGRLIKSEVPKLPGAAVRRSGRGIAFTQGPGSRPQCRGWIGLVAPAG